MDVTEGEQSNSKYERIKHHVNSTRLTGDRYTPGWKLDALLSVRNIKREKKNGDSTLKGKNKQNEHNKEIRVNEQSLVG